MKEVTRKDMGKAISTMYSAGSFSLKEYENGFEIKPVKQKSIFMKRGDASDLATWIRDKKELYTWPEARERVRREVSEQL